MKPAVMLLLAAASACAAEDYSWTRVRELTSGAEIRIFRSKAQQPLPAKFERASEQNLIVVTKTGQESIAREDVERVELRVGEPTRWKMRADRRIPRKGAEISGNDIPGATTSVKAGLNLPAKSGFEKIYDRAAESK